MERLSAGGTRTAVASALWRLLRNGDGVGPLLIIATALWRLLPDLSHPAIHNWDEAMHLAVARGLMDTPMSPHVLPVLLHPVDPHDWVNSAVWLHKPPGSLWLSALSMAIFGVGTGAARLPSLIAMTAVALCVYALLKPVTNRVFATVTPMVLLSLPFTFELVHGYMFGDLTDTTLAGSVAGAVTLLIYGAKKDSAPAIAAAGGLVGYGFLCKSALALAPVGVAFGLCALHVFKLAPGLRPVRLLLLCAIAAAVALPWTLYASHTWPELWAVEAEGVLQHLTIAGASGNPAIATWIRPVDAVFNEVHARTLAPIPRAVPLLAGLWLLYSAVRTRSLERVAVAGWLWATWIVLSLSAAKVPASTWGAIGAVFFALGVLFHDGLTRPSLAGAALGALLSDALTGVTPAPLISLLPSAFAQSRDGRLVDGLLLAGVGAAVGFALTRKVATAPAVNAASTPRNSRPDGVLIGLTACAGAIAYGLPGAFLAQQQFAQTKRSAGFITYIKDAGQTLAKVAPHNAVVLLNADRNSNPQFETHNVLFWTGRTVVTSKEDLKLATDRGHKPYLLSPQAEPWDALDVPAGAWMRAYDLSVPAPPPPLPRGVRPLDVAFGGQRLIGVATIRTPFETDRWAFFIEPNGNPVTIEVAFLMKNGQQRTLRIPPENSLKRRSALANARWFVLPAIGPKTEDVTALRFNHTGQLVQLQ